MNKFTPTFTLELKRSVAAFETSVNGTRRQHKVGQPRQAALLFVDEGPRICGH
ncbi:hypothetical protein J6590_034422 [Homalodisca vitripennis]|nr:hypothetical protein J6590_034422 [Homalodisca vitripennis]